MTGMPQGKIVKMPYFHNRSVTGGTAGVHELQVYRLNSIYDPDLTNVLGGQPLTHDEFATFYGQYQVVGAKVTTTFRWLTSNFESTRNVMCFAFPDSDSTAPSTLATKRERYPGKCRILNARPGASVTIKNFYSAKKFHNISDIKDEHQLKAAFNASPFLEAYLVAGCQDELSASTLTPVVLQTVISYMVRLIDPKPILGS